MKAIGIDIDNVLSATAAHVLPLLQAHAPGFQMDDWRSFNLYDCSAITRDQQRAVFDEFERLYRAGTPAVNSESSENLPPSTVA